MVYCKAIEHLWHSTTRIWWEYLGYYRILVPLSSKVWPLLAVNCLPSRWSGTFGRMVALLTWDILEWFLLLSAFLIIHFWGTTWWLGLGAQALKESLTSQFLGQNSEDANIIITSSLHLRAPLSPFVTESGGSSGGWPCLRPPSPSKLRKKQRFRDGRS
jgi:hypothetical protein